MEVFFNMNLKKLFLLFILLFNINFIYADLNIADQKAYYSFDDGDLSGNNPLDLTGNGFTGSNLGATTGVTGIINQSFNYDGISDEVTLPSSLTLPSSGWSINLWANITSLATTQVVLSKNLPGMNNDISIEVNSGNLRVAVDNGVTTGSIVNSSIDPRDSKWHMWTITYDGSDMKAYFDSELAGQVSISNAGIISSGKLWQFANDRGNVFMGGKIDETGLWDTNLSQSDVELLYNSGLGFQYPYVIPPQVPEIQADVKQYYRSKDINITLSTNINTSMNYELDGGSKIFLCANCTNYELFLFNLSESTHEIKFISELDGNTKNSSYNFTVDTTFPIITNNIPNEIYSYFFNGSYFNCGDTNILSCTITIQGNTYNQGVDFDVDDHGLSQYNLTATDLAGNNLTVENNTFFNPIITFQAEDENDVQVEEFKLTINDNQKETSNGSVTYLTYNDDLEFGVNDIEFRGEGYVVDNFTFNFSASTKYLTPITLDVQSASVTINVFDRTNGNLINNLTSEVIIYNIGNKTTNDGMAVFNNSEIQKGEYSSQVVVEGYNTEQKSFEYNGEQNAQVNFFLLQQNQSNVETLFVTTTDEYDNLLFGVDVRLQEYDVDSKSFIEVSNCISNSNGECQFLIELKTKSYRLIGTTSINGVDFRAVNPIGDNDGEIFEPVISGGEDVLGKDIIRNLRLKISSALTPLDTYGLTIIAPHTEKETIVSQDENSSTINLNVEYLATNGLNYNVCVTVYLIQKFNKEFVEETCDFGSSGIVHYNNYIIDRDFNWQFEISYQYDNNPTRIYKTYNYESKFSFNTILEQYSLVGWAAILLWIIILSLALWQENITTFIIGGSILSVVQFGLYPNVFVGSGSVITIVIGYLVFKVARKEVDLQ